MGSLFSMHFDRLAGIAERHFPELKQLVSDARLFRLEPSATSDTDKVDPFEWEPDERVIENYRLPFPCIAIEEAERREDKGDDGCTIFQVQGKPDDRRFRFLHTSKDRFATGVLVALPGAEIPTKRQQANVLRLISMKIYEVGKHEAIPIEFDLTALERAHWNDRHPLKDDAMKLGEQILQNQINVGRDEARRIVDEACGGVGVLNQDIARAYSQIVYLCLLSAVYSVFIINEPARFIVEERPAKEMPKQRDRIQRSMHRPHYIVLTPRQVRTRLLLPDPEITGAKRAPHERRGHFRKLQSDRYVNAKGAVLWIKPVWVGATEATVGKNKYIVRVDL